MIKVTIGIALYNLSDYIWECVDSALNQDFDDYEVLLCDDCSTDNSLKIIEEKAPEAIASGKLRIVKHYENKGIAAVRNTCIDEARGEYIMFLDGDDYISQDAVSTTYNKAIETSAEVVMANFQTFTVVNGVKIFNSPARFKTGLIKSEFAIAEWMKQNETDYFFVYPWGKMFKVNWLKNNDIRCDEKHIRNEDLFLTLEYSLVTKSILSLENVISYYRVRSGSSVHAEFTMMYFNQFNDIFDKSIKLLSDFREKHQNISLPLEINYIITARYTSSLALYRALLSESISSKDKKRYVKKIGNWIRAEKKLNTSLMSYNRKITYNILRMKYLNYYALMLLIKIQNIRKHKLFKKNL